MKSLILHLSFMLFAKFSLTQDFDKIAKIMGSNPLFFIDSVETDASILYKIDPNDIANIEILKPKTAKKEFGVRGKDGAMRITTKTLAKKCYWRFLISVSSEYAKVVPTPESDTSIVYILNDSVMTVNPSGNLYLVNNKNFKRLLIIPKSDLESKYGIFEKRFGVLVKTKMKKNKIKT